MLRALRRRSVRPARAPLLCPSCGAAAAGPLRSRRGARLVARRAGRARADDVAVPRAAAALRRRDAGHAGRRVHAAAARRARSARRSDSTTSTSRTSRSTRPTRSRRAACRRRSPGPRRSARHDLRCRPPATPAMPPRPTRPPPVCAARSSCRATPSAVRRRVRAVRRGRHAGRRPDHRRRARWPPRPAKPLGWYDVSTLKEPYRVEGKKTMGYELAEQLGWPLPDWIIYPTGGGTGMVGMWKAFDEMEALGWIGADSGRTWCRCRPRAARRSCAPSSRAPSRRRRGRTPDTAADGLRVPRAIGDFLILRAIRESGGTALAVTDAADGRRHAGDRPPRRHLRGAGRRRGARGARVLVGDGHDQARTTPSCCSTPAAR